MRRRTTLGRNQVRLPTGSPPGWTNIFADDMNYTYAVGAIDSLSTGVLKSTSPAFAELSNRFTFYPDTWSTSHDGAIDSTTSAAIVSKYYPTKTISFSNSVARVRLHTEVIGGVSTACCGVIKPIVPGGYKMGPYGKVSFRMRATSVLAADGTDLAAANNYTTSTNLYWNWVPLAIDSNNWPAGGELDAPEGSVNRAVAMNYHPAASTNQTYHYTTVDSQNPNGISPFNWNLYSWEWTPGRFRWLVNGKAYVDTTDRVPTLAMAFLFQFETDNHQPAGEGTIEIDWCSIWNYTP